MTKKYEESGSSSGANSSRKPPTIANIGPLSLMTDKELIEYEQKNGRIIDPNIVDVKKLKRTIANRISAQKSRLKKFKHVEEMENKVRGLEDNINSIKLEIKTNKTNQESSQMQKRIMNQRLDFLSKKSDLNKEEIERNKAEAKFMREVVQTMKQNILNAQNEKNRSLDHYGTFQGSFNLHPNGESQITGKMFNQFSNLEDFINNKQHNYPGN